MSDVDSVAPAAPPASSKDRLTYGVLAIVLGVLGIHKFYLGHWKYGLILLLVCILSAGILGVATFIIGVISGVIALWGSEAEFQQRYVIEKRLL